MAHFLLNKIWTVGQVEKGSLLRYLQDIHMKKIH